MEVTFLFIITLVPVLIILCLFNWSRRQSFFLRTIVLGATLIHELLLIVFPTFYSIFTNFELENKMVASVTQDDILLVMMGEMIFILTFSFGIVLRLPRFTLQGLGINGLLFNQRAVFYFLKILIIAGCLVYVPQALSSVLNFENMVLIEAVRYLTGIFWFTPLVACAFLITKRGGNSINFFWIFLAIITLICVLVIGFNNGLRGRIIWVVSLLFIAGIYNQQKKIIAIGVVLCILLVPIFTILGKPDTRANFTNTSSQSEIFTQLYEAGKQTISNSEESLNELLESYSWRAQGVRNSAILYQDYEHGGGGFKTYLGGFFVVIPRYFFEEKPIIGSIGNDLSDMAIYKVMSLGYEQEGTMGPLLASAHAYWEGGWIWLGLAGLITGLFWNMVFCCCRKLPDIIGAIIIFTIAASLLSDGLLTMLVPLYSIINTLWLDLLPLFIICIGILITIKPPSSKLIIKNLHI